MRRLLALTAVGTMALAVPALAKPTHPAHPDRPSQTDNPSATHRPASTPARPDRPSQTDDPSAAHRPASTPARPDRSNRADHPSATHRANARAQSRRCRVHRIAYIVHGALVDASLTKNDDGTSSGTLTVHVRRANRHARGDRGKDTTYTLDHARVRFGHGVDATAPAAGSRVHVIGRVTTLAKRCDRSDFTPEVTVRRVVVLRAHAPADTQG